MIRLIFKKNEIEFDINNYSDEDIIRIEGAISLRLQTKGFNENETPNKYGLMCESILDELYDL